MDKNTLLVWDKFSDYKFYEDGHYYTYKDVRVQTSVTQFIKHFCQPFDEDKWSKHIANKEGISQEEVLGRWKRLSKLSCDVGTLFHARAEQLCANKIIKVDNQPDEIQARLTKLIKLQDKFFTDIKHRLIPLKTEFTVSLEDKIAGNIDLIAWNEKDQEIQIWDYKTNKDLRYENNFGSKMLYDFAKFDDCEFYHYCLQLNIYKYILTKVTGLSIGKCYIAWFNENNSDYQVFLADDLQEKVKNIFENC